MNVVWSEETRLSLESIYQYISKYSPRNAEMVIDTLLDIGESPQDTSVEYAKEPILNDERFRVIPKWNYKLVYERKQNKVVILDVFSTKQNPMKMKKIVE